MNTQGHVQPNHASGSFTYHKNTPQIPPPPRVIHAVTLASLAWRLLPFLQRSVTQRCSTNSGIHKGHRLTGRRHIAPGGDLLSNSLISRRRGRKRRAGGRRGGMVGGREEKKITSNIQGQQPSFKSHLNKVRFLSPL